MTSTTDTHSKERIWTLGRIVALLAIAAAVAGLAHARFAQPAGSASVPAGAHAGQLTLKPCTYPTERGDLRADCGTLVVPERRADPKSRLIALPVTRVRSTSAHPREPIFRLEGGPGKTNMDFPFASRYLAERDVVLVGYRGVDGSARLDCPEVDSARRHAADLLGASALRASARALRACADRLRADGFDLAGYTLPERVDDLDAARRALGYGRVDLLSESFGTRVALVYAWRRPRSIHRSIMIGVNPPGHFVWQPARTDEQLRRFAALCRQDAACPGDLVASMRRAAVPKRWGPFPIQRGNVELASFFGLMEASPDAGLFSAPVTLDAWRSAADGDGGGLWLQSLAAGLIFPRAQVWGDTAAMGRIDAAAATRHFRDGRNERSILRDAGSRFLWAGGAAGQAWPAGPDEGRYVRLRASDVPTLLISGELDGATPAANARELLPHLRNGRSVLLAGFGHTTDFWNNQVAAGNRLVNHYLSTGRVDASRYVRQEIDFSPSTRQSSLAKALVGAMVGLALAALLSAAWMVRRVAKRGRLPRGTRAVARSLGAVVLGLGGWIAVALVALIAAPGVPIDDAGLMALGMGVPAAVATWCGWRDRDRAVGGAAGLLVALLGALVGAWLGLGSATAPAAVATTLVGAVAGANLALIACDVAAQVSGRRRATAPAVGDAREPTLHASHA